MTKLEQIFVLALMIGIICGLGVASTMLRAHADTTSKEIKNAIHDGKEIGKDAADILNDEFKDKDECDNPKSEACKVSREDNNDAPDEVVAERNAKNGNDLTVILKLTYGKLDAKWYKKVSIEVGKYFDKFYDLSKKPGKVTIKHLEIPEGKSFKVYVNNYKTDDGNQVNMHNSQCKCPETASIRVP